MSALGELGECNHQAIGIHLDRVEAAGDVAAAGDGIVEERGDLVHAVGVNRSGGIVCVAFAKAGREGACHESDGGELLAETIVEVLADAALLALRDADDLALKAGALADLGRELEIGLAELRGALADAHLEGVIDLYEGFLALAEEIESMGALYELADLDADGGNDVNEALAGVRGVGAEELDDALDLAGEENGEGECGAKAEPGGGAVVRGAAGRGEAGEKEGLPRGPDAAGEALAFGGRAGEAAAEE